MDNNKMEQRKVYLEKREFKELFVGLFIVACIIIISIITFVASIGLILLYIICLLYEKMLEEIKWSLSAINAKANG